ncbi:MAG: TraB/GumN family protein [Saprospiraceae bacterium]
MKNHFLNKNLLLAVFAWIGINACSTSKAVSADTKASVTSATLDKSLLWEITGNGLKKPSYLFGTIHLIGKEDFFFPNTLEEKIKASDQATFEIDMDDMSSMESMMKIMGKAFMKDGITLSDLITEEEYKTVEETFNAKGLPLQMLERMKPLLLSTFASMDMGDDGMAGFKSYEMEIYSKVQEQNKESNGLETMDDQLAIFDSIPYKTQAKMLLESIKSSDKDNQEYKKMIDIYKKQDIEELARVAIQDESGGIGNYEDLFLYNRNRNWIPIMSKMMLAKSTFFAVGAGHLGGTKGVINLLKKAGFKVNAVKMGLGA